MFSETKSEIFTLLVYFLETAFDQKTMVKSLALCYLYGLKSKKARKNSEVTFS